MSKITFWAAPLPLYVTFCQLFCQPPSPPSQVMYLSNGPIPLAKKKPNATQKLFAVYNEET